MSHRVAEPGRHASVAIRTLADSSCGRSCRASRGAFSGRLRARRRRETFQAGSLPVSSEAPKPSYHRNALFGCPEFNLRLIEWLLTMLLVLEHQTCAQPKERTMPFRFERLGCGKGRRCAVCESNFGLVRHYSWRTPFALRSASIASRRTAKNHDRFLIALDQTPEDRARAS